jgi:S-(hydroxymethyl)glutathione dehydrogenase / alcohol dehydrogenase
VQGSEPANQRCTGLVLERRGEPPRLMPLVVGPPGAGEVRVRMTAAGVCHTDLTAVRDARSVPLLLGHEGTGIVESTGPDVTEPVTGTPVVLAWRSPCRTCSRCRAGRGEYCDVGLRVGGPRVHSDDGRAVDVLLDTGCFAAYVVVPAKAAIPIERDTPPEVAAVVGCAVATGVGAVLWTARVASGESVAVWGAGGVGLNVVAGARIAGATPIVAVDPLPARRQDALDWGATHVATPAVAGEVIAEATAGVGVDHAFEVVGAPEVMAQALAALARGGELVLVGAAPRDAELTFHPRAFMSSQHRIVGCIYGSVHPARDFPTLLEWVAVGTLPVRRQIANTIGLSELPAAFARPSTGERTVVLFAP